MKFTYAHVHMLVAVFYSIQDDLFVDDVGEKPSELDLYKGITPPSTPTKNTGNFSFLERELTRKETSEKETQRGS